MPKRTLVPLTGSVLKWAIEDAAFTEAEFAERLQVSVDQVRRWIAEEERPSLTEFRKVTRVLKRPTAFFLLPEPPEKKPAVVQFRQTPGLVRRSLNPEEARSLREAQRLQSTASWALKEMGEGEVHLPLADTEDKPADLAETERERIGVSLETQQNWTTDRAALKAWRQALEDSGFLVFQFQLGRGSCRGFSLWDEYAPVVAVNTHYNPTARIYTLFHEYAHLLLRESSVCESFSSPRGTERWCERFAAALLLPADPVGEFLRKQFNWDGNPNLNFEAAKKVARRYTVSLRAAAMRLIDLGAAPRGLYGVVHETVPEGGVGKGGPRLKRPERRLYKLGSRLPSILLSAKKRNILKLHDLVDYVDLSAAGVAELEGLVSRGGDS